MTRQTGTHMRVTYTAKPEHHVTIPAHKPMKIGTLNAILRDVAKHHQITKAELVETVFS